MLGKELVETMFVNFQYVEQLDKFEFYRQVNIQDLGVDKLDFKCRL